MSEIELVVVGLFVIVKGSATKATWKGLMCFV